MAENTYKCPKCSATLKLGNPVPAGKKIKCPKCENIFAPVGAEAAGNPPHPPLGKGGRGGVVAPTAKPKLDDEEETGGGTYGLIKDEPSPETKKEAEEDQDKGEGKRGKKKDKSQKGAVRKKAAAQAICQKPSNHMLATASFMCVSCLLSVMVGLWPVLFTTNKKWTVSLIGMDVPVLVLIPLIVGAFLYNGLIAVGAVKMQSAESYRSAMLGAMLTVIPGSWLLAIPALYWYYTFLNTILTGDVTFPGLTILAVSGWYLYVGLTNLKTLRDPEVVEGFAEKSSEY